MNMIMLSVSLASFYAMVLFDILCIYLAAGVVTYMYTVFKSYEVTSVWTFKIEEDYIGICKYPKWLIGWMHWLAVKLKWV